MEAPIKLSYAAVGTRRIIDWRGWVGAVGVGVVGGALIGSGSSGTFHWDRWPGPITAGAILALAVALLAKRRRAVKAMVGDVVVVGACMATITLRHWHTGHWPVGHIDGKWPFIAAGLLLLTCGAGAVVTLLAYITRRATAA